MFCKYIWGGLPFFLATLFACAPADPNGADDGSTAGGDASTAPGDFAAASDELDSVYAVFTRAYAEADVQLLMDSVYARDGYYLPPNAPILEGQQSFRGQFESFLGPIAASGDPGPRISFDIHDRGVSEDLAYDIGVYTIRRPDASADAPGSRGKFIVIWKRDAEGRWRIHADGFSAMGD